MFSTDVQMLAWLVLVVWGAAFAVGLALYALDALAGWIFRRRVRRW